MTQTQGQAVSRYGLLRDRNFRTMLEYLAMQGPHSRVELAEQLDLSQPSVSRMVDALLHSGLLQEGRRIASKAGRRQTLLDINPRAAVVCGVSVRATFIRVTLADFKGNAISRQSRERHPASAEELVDQVRQMVTTELARLGLGTSLAGLALGIPGVWDITKQQVRAVPNVPELDGVDMLDLLKHSFSDMVHPEAVAVDNAVNYAAIGEGAYGVAMGCNDFFYLSIGSGAGGGLVIDNRVHQGFQGFGGEIGLLPVWSEGKLLPLEHLVSRSALVETSTGAGLGEDWEDLFRRAEGESEQALEILAELSKFLAQAICAVTILLNPQLVVLGGSVGRYSATLIPSIEMTTSTLLPISPRIVATTLGGDASISGAVAHALELARKSLVMREVMQ